MAITDSFRQHHTELLQIATEMSRHLNAEQLKKDANEIRSMLSKLSGKLNVHLTMEDKSLYPSLLNHTDPNLKLIANRFIKEMGGIKEVFGGYLKKWPTPSSIQANAAEFVAETKNIFSALSKRIEKEDKELYSLVDKAGK